MPRKPEPTFPTALLPFALARVESAGGDVERLRAKYLAEATTEGTSILVSHFRGFMEEAAKEAGDPLFGVNCALSLPRGFYGLLEFALRSAPTGRAVLDQLVEFGALINPAVRFSLQQTREELALHHQVPHSPDGVGRHGNYFTVVRFVVMGREMISPSLSPTRVWFAHRERSARSELASAVGTSQIAFGRTSNGVAYDEKSLDVPLAGADPQLNQVLCEHARALLSRVLPEGLYQRTRQALVALLPEGRADLRAVAKRLSLSDRTLQRRLAEEGVAFAQLTNEVRADLALQLLAAADAPITTVAEQLGYADAATFTRAFKRWTGKTPGAWRAQTIG